MAKRKINKQAIMKMIRNKRTPPQLKKHWTSYARKRGWV